MFSPFNDYGRLSGQFFTLSWKIPNLSVHETSVPVPEQEHWQSVLPPVVLQESLRVGQGPWAQKIKSLEQWAADSAITPVGKSVAVNTKRTIARRHRLRIAARNYHYAAATGTGAGFIREDAVIRRLVKDGK